MADITRLQQLVAGIPTGVDLTSNRLLVDQLALKDVGGSNYVTLDVNETLTADRTLSIVLNDGDRTLTLNASAALNQDLETTDSPTFAGLVLTGDVDLTAADRIVTLNDNSASALSFDSTGKTGILSIDTTDGAETVRMSGSLVVTGDFTVNGTTTTVNTTNLEVTDKLITINNGGAAASGGGSGIEVEEDSVITGYFKVATDRNGWELKAPNNAGILTIDITASKTLTANGDLNIEADSAINQDLTTDAAPTFAGVTLTGDITTTGAAVDWDLADNNASALSFDSAGKAGILEIVTTDAAEGVNMSGFLNIGSSTAITSILDEDNMASDSATALATQQSIKAYVDAAATAAEDLQKTVTLGENMGTAAEDHIFPVRYAKNGETAGAVYKANKDDIANANVVGWVETSGVVTASSTANMVHAGIVSLGANDTAFGASDIGKPVYLDGSGTWSVTAPTTAGEVVFKVGIVATTTTIFVEKQLNGVN